MYINYVFSYKTSKCKQYKMLCIPPCSSEKKRYILILTKMAWIQEKLQNFDGICLDLWGLISCRNSKYIVRAGKYIYKSLQPNVHRLPHPRSRGPLQELLLVPSADNQTCNYDTDCSNHHLSLSTLKTVEIELQEMKWWAMCLQIYQ